MSVAGLPLISTESAPWDTIGGSSPTRARSSPEATISAPEPDRAAAGKEVMRGCNVMVVCCARRLIASPGEPKVVRIVDRNIEFGREGHWQDGEPTAVVGTWGDGNAGTGIEGELHPVVQRSASLAGQIAQLQRDADVGLDRLGWNRSADVEQTGVVELAGCQHRVAGADDHRALTGGHRRVMRYQMQVGLLDGSDAELSRIDTYVERGRAEDRDVAGNPELGEGQHGRGLGNVYRGRLHDRRGCLREFDTPVGEKLDLTTELAAPTGDHQHGVGGIGVLHRQAR